MTSLENLLEPILHSPRLPELVDALKKRIEAEKKLRSDFYQNMTPEQKVEFIDGEVILHSPARNRHLDATLHTATLLKTFVSRHQLGSVKCEKCLCVFPRNDYEPDVVFFGLEKTALIHGDTMQFPPPDLAVEVLSASTEKNDRGVKFEDFAANGVAEYWIIDADGEILEQYLPGADGYELKIKSNSGILKSAVIPGFQCEIAALFDEKKNLVALQEILRKNGHES